MAYVAVTLEHSKTTHDLALPMHIPTRSVIDGIAQTFKIPRKHGQSFYFGIKSDAGTRPISPNATLGDGGVLHGMILVLLEQRQSDAPPKTGAYLQSDDGAHFALGSKTTLIGRNDPKSGIFVDVDLTSLATDPKAISRKHAQIEQEGDRFYLVDVGSVNGTKVNGERVGRERKPVWNGDILEFGRNAARLTFCGGEKK